MWGKFTQTLRFQILNMRHVILQIWCKSWYRLILHGLNQGTNHKMFHLIILLNRFFLLEYNTACSLYYFWLENQKKRLQWNSIFLICEYKHDFLDDTVGHPRLPHFRDQYLAGYSRPSGNRLTKSNVPIERPSITVHFALGQDVSPIPEPAHAELAQHPDRYYINLPDCKGCFYQLLHGLAASLACFSWPMKVCMMATFCLISLFDSDWSQPHHLPNVVSSMVAHECGWLAPNHLGTEFDTHAFIL